MKDPLKGVPHLPVRRTEEETLIERIPTPQAHPISTQASTYGELDPELYQSPARADEPYVEDPLDNIGDLVQCNYCLSVLRAEDADYHSCG